MKKLIPLSLLSLLTAGSLSAQTPTATTDPVGFVSVEVLANSDAVVAVPMNRSAAFKGVIQSIAGNIITVAGTPNWTVNQFVQNLGTQNDTFAVQIATGTQEGLVATITANTADSITIQLDAGDSLTGVKTEATNPGAADQVDIMPYWTPSALFSAAPPVGFEMSGFEAADPGINNGATEIYAHAGGNVWEDGVLGGDATHSRLRFGAAFIIRNNSGTAYMLTMVGAVPMSAQRIRLATKNNNTPQDVAIGYMAPVPEALSTVGDPNVPDNEESANALDFPAEVGDAILGFDNTQSGINKGATEIYAWNGSAWEDDINGGVIDHTVTLKPGFGYIFRKAATPTPVSVVWVHVQGYLQ